MNPRTSLATPIGTAFAFALGLASLAAPSQALATPSASATAAVDLFKKVAAKSEGGNVVFSPYSASSAFAMLYPGARGETARSLAGAFGFASDLEAFGAARKAQAASILAAPTGLAQDATYELSVADTVYHDTASRLSGSYLSFLGRYATAAIEAKDFRGEAEKSRADINAKVEEQTKGRIAGLLPPGSVTSDTRLVLTNAVYFLADWKSPFPKYATHEAEFRPESGAARPVEMMRQEGRFDVAEQGGMRAVSLPYVGDTFAMLVVLPSTGTLASMESTFDATSLEGLIDALEPKRIDLRMPRFEIKADEAIDLRPALAARGASALFCGESGVDLSGLFEGARAGEHCVSAAVQKAFIRVDEKGTEAAAATGITVGTTSVPLPAPLFAVDRPALFAIYEVASKEVLFLGRLASPEAPRGE